MRRIQDWLISIEKVFEQVILLQTIPNSDIFIHVTIFQSEGGTYLCNFYFNSITFFFF